MCDRVTEGLKFAVDVIGSDLRARQGFLTSLGLGDIACDCIEGAGCIWRHGPREPAIRSVLTAVTIVEPVNPLLAGELRTFCYRRLNVVGMNEFYEQFPDQILFGITQSLNSGADAFEV
jgi:hypothetical protein